MGAISLELLGVFSLVDTQEISEFLAGVLYYLVKFLQIKHGNILFRTVRMVKIVKFLCHLMGLLLNHILFLGDDLFQRNESFFRIEGGVNINVLIGMIKELL